MSQAPLLIYLDGKLVPESEAKVSVFDHGLLYGDGCFEGIRIYNGRVFRLTEHLVRLYESARSICLTIPISLEEMEQATLQTVAANQLRDGYIRLVITRGVGSLGLNPYQCPKAGIIIIASGITLYPKEKYETGLNLITCATRRPAAAALSPQVKSLNYLNNILAKIESIDAGVLEAIMLNTDGQVAECTGDNIFLVKDGAVVTPPPEAGLLNGVTRRFVIDTLCPALGITCTERHLRLEDVYAADEVFLTGTAAEVIGVNAVGDRAIGTGRGGPVTARLTAEFRRRVASGAPED